MKKIIALFFAVLFILFSFSCLASAVEVDPEPTTAQDPWVEIVSEVAGDNLSGHEEEVKQTLTFGEKLVEGLKSFFESLRDSFINLWHHVSSFFDSVKEFLKID